MKILYIKRAYNTRLHMQINALYERGHSILLLLEAPIENGYNGPAQWDLREIHSRFPLYYSTPVKFQTNLWRSKGKAFLSLINKIQTKYGTKQDALPEDFGAAKKNSFLQALDRVLLNHKVDIIISANDAIETEDYRTKLVITALKRKIPVIYDCQDILSDCFTGNKVVEDIERFVNEEADGVVHTNPIGLKWMTSRYSIKKSLSFPNYGSVKHFRKKRPKLSEKDGKTHLVYCGSVQKTPEGYDFSFARDMKNMFEEIAALGFPLHLHLGLYPGNEIYNYYMKLKNSRNVILHPYVPFDEMMNTLTQYDISLLPVDLGSLKHQVEREGPKVLDDFFLSRADTSKQYEYTLAGLPVLTLPIKWVSTWLSENNFGTSFNSISHLRNILNSGEIEEYIQSVTENASKFSIENMIESLENFCMRY